MKQCARPDRGRHGRASPRCGSPGPAVHPTVRGTDSRRTRHGKRTASVGALWGHQPASTGDQWHPTATPTRASTRRAGDGNRTRVSSLGIAPGRISADGAGVLHLFRRGGRVPADRTRPDGRAIVARWGRRRRITRLWTIGSIRSGREAVTEPRGRSQRRARIVPPRAATCSDRNIRMPTRPPRPRLGRPDSPVSPLLGAAQATARPARTSGRCNHVEDLVAAEDASVIAAGNLAEYPELDQPRDGGVRRLV
jgi:hypothetical protein